MGDDIGLGLVTGCPLRSLGDHRQQTELHYVGWAKNKSKRYPNLCHHPLIPQLRHYYYLAQIHYKYLAIKYPVST